MATFIHRWRSLWLGYLLGPLAFLSVTSVSALSVTSNSATSADDYPYCVVFFPVTFQLTNTTGSDAILHYGPNSTADAQITVAPGTSTQTVWATNPSLYFNRGRMASVCWSGLNSSTSPKSVSSTAATCSLALAWGSTTAAVAVMTLPVTAVTVTYLSSDGSTHFLAAPAQVVTIATGSNVCTLPAPPTNPLWDLAGTSVTVPFAGVGGAAHTIVVGGVTYRLDGTPSGCGSFAFTVPTHWDGSITFDGTRAIVGLSYSFEGNPSAVIQNYWGNIYDATLPPGMTAYAPSITPPLPDGMTSGSKVPLPSGMTALSAATKDPSGTISMAFSTASGTTGAFAVPSTGTVAPLLTGPAGTNTPSAIGTASTPAGVPTTATEIASMASAAKGSGLADASMPSATKTALDGMAGVKDTIAAKFGFLNNLVPTSYAIGRANTLSVVLPFPGRTVSTNIDLTGYGIPWVRAAWIFAFGWMYTFAFFQKLTV